METVNDSHAGKRGPGATRDHPGAHNCVSSTAEPQLCVLTTPSGRVTRLQFAWQAFTGLDRKAQHGFGWLVALHPDDRDSILAAWSDPARFRHGIAVRVRHAAGAYQAFALHREPLADKAGWQVCLQRPTSNQHVIDLYRALVDRAPSGIVQFALDGALLLVNPALAALTGFTAAALLRMKLSEITCPDDLAHGRAQLQRLLRNEATAIMVEKRLQQQSGGWRWVQMTASLVRDEFGQPAYFVGIIEDIAERKHLEQMKDEFLDLAGHELRAPLTSLVLAARMLARRVEQADRLESLPRLAIEVVQRAQQLSRIVDTMQEMSRVYGGRLTLQPATTDLGAVARDVADSYAAIWQREVRVQGAATPLMIQADGERLWQVFSNVIQNALKYSPASAAVDVEVRRDAARQVAQVIVRDQGAGIDPAYLPQVFDLFFRAADVAIANPAERGEGLGLGLYISRAIIDAHNGNISITSSPGAGATVTIELPLDPAAVVPAPVCGTEAAGK